MGPKNFSFQVCVIFWIKRKGIEWTWFQSNLFCKVFFGLPVVKTAQWVPKISLFKFVSFFGSKETESNELGVNITLRNLFPFLPSRSKSNLNPMNWNEPSVKNGMKHSHSFLQDNLKKNMIFYFGIHSLWMQFDYFPRCGRKNGLQQFVNDINSHN